MNKCFINSYTNIATCVFAHYGSAHQVIETVHTVRGIGQFKLFDRLRDGGLQKSVLCTQALVQVQDGPV